MAHLFESLEALLELAALAPSSHNCQPWRVDLREAPGGAVLGITIDPRRRLRALPALEREMRISVGGFAAILLNLLRQQGCAVRAVLPAAGEVLVELHLAWPAPPGRRATSPAFARLADALQQRHTERGPYRAGEPLRLAPPRTMLPHSLAGDAGALGRVLPPLGWTVLTPGPRFDRICALVRDEAARDFLHPQAWPETYRHLDFSAAPRRADGTGINIQSLFGAMPAWRRQLHRWLLHPRAVGLLGRLGPAGRIGSELEALVRSSPALLVLTGTAAAAPARRQELLAGEWIADLWLAAGATGQGLHPLSVILQHAETSLALRRALSTELEPLFIARAGSPVQRGEARFRYRRPARAFCLPAAGAA